MGVCGKDNYEKTGCYAKQNKQTETKVKTLMPLEYIYTPDPFTIYCLVARIV